ncbi:archaemetzincin family Zn-dependent metalloprotease [candidate division WOR-3 bacterium]|nr:archaemetzincin family Zn-dependent metalloprotease [candidate division WOR-3 bacterium]
MTTAYQQNGLDYFHLIERSLLRNMNIEVRRGGHFDVPDDAYSRTRRQYDPRSIIIRMAGLKDRENELSVGIVDVDLYARGKNFIFGIALPLYRSALVSVFRLTGPRLTERLSKEVLHETGHLCGLFHCADPTCVMHFSNTVKDTDEKTEELCTDCRRQIEK